MADIYEEIAAERRRAHAKHGDTSMESAPVDDPTGMRRDIIIEELGEVAREFNEARHDRRPVDLGLLRKELIQVAAMAAAWADRIEVAADWQTSRDETAMALRMHDVQYERANRLEAQRDECHRIIGAVEALVKDSDGAWLHPGAFGGLAGEIQNVIAGECV